MSTARVERVELSHTVHLFEIENLFHDAVGDAGITVAQGVQIRGYSVAQTFRAGQVIVLGSSHGLLRSGSEEGRLRAAGGGVRGNRRGGDRVGVRYMREMLAVVKTDEDVGDGKVGSVGAKETAGLGGHGDGSGIRADVGRFEDDVSVDEEVIDGVEVGVETLDDLASEPGILMRRWPAAKLVLVKLAETLAEAVEGTFGCWCWGGSDGPHLRKIEIGEPDLCSMYSLEHLLVRRFDVYARYG